MDRELLIEIVKDIYNFLVEHEEMQSFALVFEASADITTANYGFWYNEAGEGFPFSIDNPNLDEKVSVFRESSPGPDGEWWIKGLFTYLRSSKKIAVDFEFDDDSRWEVTPGNQTKLMMELRPKS